MFYAVHEYQDQPTVPGAPESQICEQIIALLVLYNVVGVDFRVTGALGVHSHGVPEADEPAPGLRQESHILQLRHRDLRNQGSGGRLELHAFLLKVCRGTHADSDAGTGELSRHLVPGLLLGAAADVMTLVNDDHPVAGEPPGLPLLQEAVESLHHGHRDPLPLPLPGTHDPDTREMGSQDLMGLGQQGGGRHDVYGGQIKRLDSGRRHVCLTAASRHLNHASEMADDSVHAVLLVVPQHHVPQIRFVKRFRVDPSVYDFMRVIGLREVSGDFLQESRREGVFLSVEEVDSAFPVPAIDVLLDAVRHPVPDQLPRIIADDPGVDVVNKELEHRLESAREGPDAVHDLLRV